MRFVVEDPEVGVSALGVDSPATRDAAAGFALATVSSTPISRSPSNMEVAPARSSSTPVPLPRPLPLPSPAPKILDGEWNGPAADAPGVLETGCERMTPLLSRR